MYAIGQLLGEKTIIKEFVAYIYPRFSLFFVKAFQLTIVFYFNGVDFFIVYNFLLTLVLVFDSGTM